MASRLRARENNPIFNNLDQFKEDILFPLSQIQLWNN